MLVARVYKIASERARARHILSGALVATASTKNCKALKLKLVFPLSRSFLRGFVGLLLEGLLHIDYCVQSFPAVMARVDECQQRKRARQREEAQLIMSSDPD